MPRPALAKALVVGDLAWMLPTSVAANPDGSFVVVWDGSGADSYYYSVFGQQFDSSGNPRGGEFTVTALSGQRAPKTASAPNGDFLVVWEDAYGFDGDRNGIVGRRFADAPHCTPAPKTSCRVSIVDRRSILKMKEDASARADRVIWRWARGEQKSLGDFGDPFNTTDYAFCLYDASANPQPTFSLVAPADGTCRGRPCWLELSGGRPEFNDPDSLQGGLRRLRLKPGDPGRAQVAVVGRGENLTLPALPLAPPVTAQLQAGNGECWTATYDTLIRKNEGSLFRAKPGSPSAAFLDVTTAALY